MGLEQMRKPDAARLEDQSQQRAVAIERPRTSRLDDLECRLIAAIDEAVVDSAYGVLVSDLDGLVALPLDVKTFEPLRVCRRLIGLSYAAMSDCSRAA
jgi:hypothetical protein